MPVNFQELRKAKSDGSLIVLPYRRTNARVKDKILFLLYNEALTVGEIKDRLNLKTTTIYNALRRFEKAGTVVALDYDGKTVFLEKHKAEAENLI